MTSRSKVEMRQEAYRIYVTDGIKILAENTANLFGGKSISARYYELCNPVEDIPEEEDVVDHIKDKLMSLGKG